MRKLEHSNRLKSVYCWGSLWRMRKRIHRGYKTCKYGVSNRKMIFIFNINGFKCTKYEVKYIDFCVVAKNVELCRSYLKYTVGEEALHLTPVASFTKEVSPRLAIPPLIFNGRLANRGLTSLVKEATGGNGFVQYLTHVPHQTVSPRRDYWVRRHRWMMTSSNGTIFRVTGHLWGESTGHQWIPLLKANDAELWCFLWSAPEQTFEQTIETPVIWDAIALIMTSLLWTIINQITKGPSTVRIAQESSYIQWLLTHCVNPFSFCKYSKFSNNI